jgi:hypothetical protein
MPIPPQTRPRLRQDERGMALAIALFAIVVIGALVAGTAFAGQMEMGGGRSAIAATQAVEQAETGLAEAFENWDPNWNALAVEATSAYSTVTSGRDRRTTSATRLGGMLVFVRSTGERLSPSGNVLATRELGQLARLTTPDVEVDAAVEGMGDVRVGGSSTVSGLDTNPTGWGGTCTGALNDVPGVRASGSVQENGTADILGAPSPTLPYVANDTSVTAQSFTDIYDALIGSVTKTLAGGNYNGMAPDTTLTQPGVCNRSNNNNWGEPGDPAFTPIISACRRYMPVILFTGGTTINGGKGQGILIIQGDLRIQGTFIFDGIILATGNIEFHGTGGSSSRIHGGLFSANSADVGDLISITGAPVISYSSCAVAAVLSAAGTGVPLARRGWVQIVY